MANVPAELKYTREHEWAKVEGDRARVGITAFAQEQLGDVVFVELPKVGAKVTALKTFGVVESVKAVSDLFAPVSGEVVEVNAELPKKPEVVNSDPYGAGWMLVIRMSDPKESDGPDERGRLREAHRGRGPLERGRGRHALHLEHRRPAEGDAGRHRGLLHRGPAGPHPDQGAALAPPQPAGGDGGDRPGAPPAAAGGPERGRRRPRVLPGRGRPTITRFRARSTI